ncbi:hypothetical protein JTE90_000688 [Oedothorax gibbosus]|uniref:Uncharacterized protein n=1 Tax=Oedothorax gibbosus TaxID=931172 RepID=A0AAV6TIC4_9ARAC|nr:hypothetical protein JTE90_000688 [Oedothorax gibbosus]
MSPMKGVGSLAVGRCHGSRNFAKECVTTHRPKQLALKMVALHVWAYTGRYGRASLVEFSQESEVNRKKGPKKKEKVACVEGAGREPAWEPPHTVQILVVSSKYSSET